MLTADGKLDVTEETFRLGSTSSSSVLLDAVDQLERKSPKADDNIQLIRQSLDEAVGTCVKAAGYEYSIHWQRQLLKAASFGKSAIDLYNSDDFVDMTETLRVLNAVRFYEVGIPLSYEQYQRLTPERLIDRLTNRGQYQLALKMSEFMRLPTDRIFVHWAKQKVRISSEPEDQISRAIVQKMKGKRGISFEEIARAAYDEGRAPLATELLNHEPRAGKQVPLLLSMKEDNIALDKAIESGDTDLVYYVLLSMKKKLPLATFFRTINTRPVATALVEASSSSQDHELLKDLYYQDDRRFDGASLLITEALSQTDITPCIDKLRSASKLLADTKEHASTRLIVDEIPRLLKQQEIYERDLQPNGFVGLSINETMGKLIRIGAFKKAQRLQSDFKVPEKAYWWIRLRAMVAERHWNELEELAKQNKKSPIGWTPFFNEALAAGSTRVAAIFVPKCTDVSPKVRVEMWVKCNQIVKAAEEASKARDLETLTSLRDKATGRDLGEVERLIARLAGRA